MRYQNWDVLLFQKDSRIPIQEFDTKYHMLPQHNNVPYEDELYLGAFESINRVPMLTSFVSSLDAGTAFRVSIHSWEPPKPSKILSNIMLEGEKVMFEARVYIDGQLMTQKTFSKDAIWPEIIESSGSMVEGKAGRKLLQFPPFHNEILDQAHWDATEAYGRIGVVIAEGVTRSDNGDHGTLVFDRLRDQIAFSFQHAPRHILEYSNIAWPNARMFRPEPKLDVRSSTLASRLALASKPDFQAHAHSPQRALDDKGNAGLAQTKIGSRIRELKDINSGWSAQRIATANTSPSFDDPFLCPAPAISRTKLLQARKSSTDASMPDYVSERVGRSREETEMSDVAYQKVDFLKHMNEAAITEIAQALSPERREELVITLSPTEILSAKEELSDVSRDISPTQNPSVILPSNRTSLKAIDVANTEPGNIVRRYSQSMIMSNANSKPELEHITNSIPSVALTSTRNQNSAVCPLNNDLPSLPGSWQAPSTISTDNCMTRTPDLYEMLSRPSSNTSKRKRLESPVRSRVLAEHITTPETSTSPSKQHKSPHDTDSGGSRDDLPLSASKWAKDV